MAVRDVANRRLRVLAGDLNDNGHVDNGRERTLVERAILERFLRSGLLRRALRKRWRPMLGGSIIS